MPFTFCFTLAMLIFALSIQKELGVKIYAAYLMLGLAVLGKGPVAFLLAIGIGLFFWLFDEQGIVRRKWRIVPGLFIAIAAALPWFLLAFKQNGFAFIATFFVNHNIARYLTEIHHHSQPFYYYVPVLIMLLFPWSAWLVLFLSKSPISALRRFREWDSGILFIGCWFLFPLIFFSISGSKLPGYILPSLPPLALLLGIKISRLMEGKMPQSRLRLMTTTHLVFSAAISVATVFYFQQSYGNWRTGLLLGCSVFLPAIFSFAYGFQGNCARAFYATVVQGIVLIVMLAQFAFPTLGAYHSTKDIALQAMKVRMRDEPIVTYQYFHHSFNYYTDYQAQDRIDDPESLLRIVRERGTCLIVTPSDWADFIWGIKAVSSQVLGKQGDLRLLRVTLRK